MHNEGELIDNPVKIKLNKNDYYSDCPSSQVHKSCNNMKHHGKMPTKLCAFLFVFSIQFFPAQSNLIVTSTESNNLVLNEKTENGSLAIPKITSMVIDTTIANRYAKTVVKSKVKNLKSSSAETSFTVILPDNAFISEFFMEIDGKVYQAYVKEKEEAKKIYSQAVSSGQSAAHVEVSARDSKTFKVSVNLEPESKVTFQLGYEELLSRDSGYYNYVVNINPGQIVPEMDIRVFLSESRPLKSVQTPALRTGKEMNKNKPNLEPDSNVEMINSTCALVTFSPDEKKQQQIAEALGTDKENGFSGQFAVRYDVERDPYGGEVLVDDGYFVHFFSPSELEPLSKHVVFVLDHSGSMMGNKIDQLIDAMENILSDLREEDFFNIVRFSDQASIWDIETNNFTNVVNTKNYNAFVETMNLSEFVPKAISASPENVEKAKIAIRDKSHLGMTNILSGLQAALYLIEKTQKENSITSYQPMVVFLTDGVPNALSSSPSEIISLVTDINSKASNKTSIFSLSLGSDADKTFLKKLSLKNLGFSRHIYEASDTSLQLEDFYKKISSPLLNNVTFKYVDGVKDVTKAYYPFLFNGSELVVAGKIPDGGNVSNIALYIKGMTKKGSAQFSPQTMESSGSLERLWAYLSLKEILKEREIASDEDASKLGKKALDLALKYSFVTEVSSLVVVKPNGTETPSDADDKDIAGPSASSISRTGWSVPRAARRRPGYAKSRGGGSWQRGSSAQSASRNIGWGWGQYSTTTQRNLKAPDWMEAIQNGNQTVTTSQGEFKLGRDTSINKHPFCTNSPEGNGTCTLLNQCTRIYPKIPDLDTYITKYFCNIDTYAGVCCPPQHPTWNINA